MWTAQQGNGSDIWPCSCHPLRNKSKHSHWRVKSPNEQDHVLNSACPAGENYIACAKNNWVWWMSVRGAMSQFVILNKTIWRMIVLCRVSVHLLNGCKTWWGISLSLLLRPRCFAKQCPTQASGPWWNALQLLPWRRPGVRGAYLARSPT